MQKTGMQKSGLHTAIKIAIGSTIVATSAAQAAGLEYTKQSILPFFEEGNYAELSYAYVDPKIEGVDASGNKVKDMMDDFNIKGAAIKIEPAEDMSLALIYDEAFGVDTKYQAGSNFDKTHIDGMGHTEARVDTRSLTVLGGGKVNENFWLYGGVEYQEAKGSVQLAQEDGGSDVFYELDIKDKSKTVIPVLGAAYEIPEIMLRASLTWRGEGTHNLPAHENMLVRDNLLRGGKTTNFNDMLPIEKQLGGLPDITLGDTNLSFKTPQSVNFDFQTGLSEKHQLLGMLNARWVEWTKFEVAPDGITEVFGEPLAEYKKDAYSVELALGKQFTKKFAGEIRAGYDSGTAEPLSLLGPYDSIKSLALGGSYDVNDQVTISAGAQYMWFEGGTAYSNKPEDKSIDERTLARFDDGDGYAVGVKLGYRF